jgi:hypothetical protein
MMLKEKLTTYRDNHKNQRCFILASGPSLNQTNLSLLNDEITIGVNTLANHPFFKCNYYCVADEQAIWSKFKGQMIQNSKRPIFTPFYDADTIKFKDGVVFHENYYMQNKKGGTVVFLGIEIAAFMGCNEIYVVGCDCSDPNGYHHYDTVKNDLGIDVVKQYAGTSKSGKHMEWHLSFPLYEKIMKQCNDLGIKLINSTVGGNLNVLPREKLEDVV